MTQTMSPYYAVSTSQQMALAQPCILPITTNSKPITSKLYDLLKSSHASAGIMSTMSH